MPQGLERAFDPRNRLQIAAATLPDELLAFFQQAARHLAAKLGEYDLVHVGAGDADKALQQFLCTGGISQGTQQLGIDAVLQELAVDQDPVAIEYDQERHEAGFNPPRQRLRLPREALRPRDTSSAGPRC